MEQSKNTSYIVEEDNFHWHYWPRLDIRPRLDKKSHKFETEQRNKSNNVMQERQRNWRDSEREAMYTKDNFFNLTSKQE